MKGDIAVFTVFRNESKLFPVWLKYYSNLFGLENVYVFDDNTSDGTFDNINLINYELLNLGRDPNAERFGVHDYGTLWQFIVGKYIELLNEYRWVIHVDSDDYVVANPEKYKNLKDFIITNDKIRGYYRCKAYEILQMDNESSLNWSENLLNQRNYWIRITNLDKTCLTRKRLDFSGPGSWVLSNHYACGSEHEKPDNDLILIHLHRIDYNNYRKKYFVKDERIKNQKDFENLYGGYPLFWRESEMIEYFYRPDANNQWGAQPAKVEKIPGFYKGVF